MDRAQVAAIIIGIFITIFFVVLFLRNRKHNHHQDLKDEVIESIVEEQDFEKVEEQ